jgi:hypothetical protein
VGGEAASEIFREPQDVGHRRAVVDLRKKIARQLPQLNPLEAQLPLRIAAGNRRSQDRGKERPLLRLRPSAQAIEKVRQAEPVSLFVAAVEGLAEVVEAGAQGGLRG